VPELARHSDWEKEYSENAYPTARDLVYIEEANTQGAELYIYKLPDQMI